MVGQLNNDQINRVLETQLIGRIGCGTQDRHYIFPVTYVFHEGSVYVHSKEGLKLKILSSNPNVCFQVDQIDNMNNWRSVLIWGKYEALNKEEEQVAALNILRNRFEPFNVSETVLPDLSAGHESYRKESRAVAYRIRIIEKTGRYEKSSVKI